LHPKRIPESRHSRDRRSTARNIKLGEKYKPRVRIYSEDELRRFWHALMSDPYVDGSVAVLKVLVLTGKRVSEVVTAQKYNLQLNGNDPRWFIRYTKNGNPDDVPLTPTVVALFSQAIAIASDSEYVFPAAPNGQLCGHLWAKTVSIQRK